MLQVIPGASPSPTPHQPVVMKQPKMAIPHPPPTPQSGIQTHGTAEISIGHSPIAKVDGCYIITLFAFNTDGSDMYRRLVIIQGINFVSTFLAAASTLVHSLCHLSCKVNDQ
jgi:hypothetical protein